MTDQPIQTVTERQLAGFVIYTFAAAREMDTHVKIEPNELLFHLTLTIQEMRKMMENGDDGHLEHLKSLGESVMNAVSQIATGFNPYKL